MKIAKRVLFFVAVNILIVATITTVTSLLGLQPYLSGKGIDLPQLIIFCLLWGFGGAFISLAISRKMAKWTMGVEVIADNDWDPARRELVQRVHALCRRSGLSVMPEVGIYQGEEINAFATGPTKSRSLVAVSSGLLEKMNQEEVEGVLAHEVAHIANGDMVTMTLLQGVVNAMVMFFARLLAFSASQFVAEENRALVQFGIVIACEMVLGMLGLLVVSYFSRQREFRADAGGARLAGQSAMIQALERLKAEVYQVETDEPALATLKISGRSSGFLSLFSTHPDLDVRIARLRESGGR